MRLVNNPILARKIGMLIRSLRRDAGYTQEAFALVAGIPRAYMGNIERGETALTVEYLEYIVSVLDHDLEYFFARLKLEPEPDLAQKRPYLRKA